MWYPAKYPEPDNRTMKKMVSKALEVGINAVIKLMSISVQVKQEPRNKEEQ